MQEIVFFFIQPTDYPTKYPDVRVRKQTTNSNGSIIWRIKFGMNVRNQLRICIAVQKKYIKS